MEKENSGSDVEKAVLVSSLDIDSALSSPVPAMTPMQYRKLIWKLDLHLLPPLFALWFVSLIDRINIGSANIFGIQADLHMNLKSNQFNIALIIVLVGLITMELPSNYLLKKWSPSKVLASESLLLAIFTIGEGLVKNFAGLCAMRFFVGVMESGLIPGSVYILAQYYPRYELQWRLSMLMVGNALSTACGGLLALAIAGIYSSNGYKPWRWIFIVEGCFTAGVTLLAYPFLPNWPTTAKWLTKEEKEVLANRIRGDGIVGGMERLDSKAIRRIVLDWKTYVCAAMACCTTVTAYSVAIFAPTIIKQFDPKQSSRHVQALVIPLFVVATVFCLATAFASDKLRHRSGFAIFGYCLTLIGSIIMIKQHEVSTNLRYGALFFMATGSYISLPMLWSMLVNNVSGSYKVGFAVALEVGIGNVGGIVSAWVFQGAHAPWYADGYKTLMGMTCAAIGLVIIYTTALWFENKARDAGKRNHRLASPDIDNLGMIIQSFDMVIELTDLGAFQALVSSDLGNVKTVITKFVEWK